jgi:hypothetical protein
MRSTPVSRDFFQNKIDLKYLQDNEIWGLYYKHVTIVNDASSGVNKLKASLNDNARVIIYDRHMFIVQATGATEVNILHV